MKNGYRTLPRWLPLILLIGLAAPTPAYAQYSLQVLDPQQPWRSVTGTIEAATVSVRPQGIYWEVGLYLTFSARSGGFTNHDTLEVELFFSLPEEAVVTDSWLWVGNDIVRADIKDTWTARTIYEDIVRRRRDPSILYKHSPGFYELRVFPMAGGETRRVKITYQVPALWTASTVSALIPTDLLRTSLHPVSNVALRVWPGVTWRRPHLVEQPGVTFVEKSGPLGTFLEAVLPRETAQRTLTLAFDAPLQDGIYLSRLPDGDETWYQLALLPSKTLNLAARRKVALLLDYDAGKTTLTQAEVLSAARTLLQTSLAPTDSFNLIVSRLDIWRVRETWLPATPEAIADAFASLGSNPMTEYSNLPSLLNNGIEFVNTHGPGGSLLLLSSADQVGEAGVANQLIEDLRAPDRRLPPVHVVDYTNRNVSYHFFGGQNFEGNGYFYTNLARITGGTYVNIRDSGLSFSELLTTSLTSLGGTISAFDLYTTLASGFCYGRFTSNEQGDAVFVDRAILQVGKCLGGFPFRIEASGVFAATPFSRSLHVDAQDAALSDTTLIAHWTGRQIQALENRTQTNAVINEIIGYSLDQRVLSRYTAFLALDPDQGGQVCNTCEDETGNGAPTAVEDETPLPGEVVLEAYPNPFHTTVTVDVRLPEPVEVSAITFAVYDVMGRLVKTLQPGTVGFASTFTLTWDGTNEAGQPVASGTYFFVMLTPTGRHTISLVLVR